MKPYQQDALVAAVAEVRDALSKRKLAKKAISESEQHLKNRQQDYNHAEIRVRMLRDQIRNLTERQLEHSHVLAIREGRVLPEILSGLWDDEYE